MIKNLLRELGASTQTTTATCTRYLERRCSEAGVTLAFPHVWQHRSVRLTVPDHRG